MTHDNFKDMVVCQFCGSETLNYVSIHFEKHNELFCDRCFQEIEGNPGK